MTDDGLRDTFLRTFREWRRLGLYASRFLLGLVLWFLAATAFHGGAALLHWIDSKRDQLESTSERLARVNPCPYLTDAMADLPGNEQGEEPTVGALLQSCTLKAMPEVEPATINDAVRSSAANLVALQKDLLGQGRFVDQDTGIDVTATQQASFVRLIRDAVLTPATAPVQNSDFFSQEDRQDVALEAATFYLSYTLALKQVVTPSALVVKSIELQRLEKQLADVRAERTKLDPAASGDQYELDMLKSRQDALLKAKDEAFARAKTTAVEAALDSRFFINQFRDPYVQANLARTNAVQSTDASYQHAVAASRNAAGFFAASFLLMWLAYTLVEWLTPQLNVAEELRNRNWLVALFVVAILFWAFLRAPQPVLTFIDDVVQLVLR